MLVETTACQSQCILTHNANMHISF